MSSEQADIAVVGMGVMGQNLARNLARVPGLRVAIYNRTASVTDDMLQGYPEANFIPAYTYQELADVLKKPRAAISMVPAGPATDVVISSLMEVFEPGDIIIDGGNALFTDTRRREAVVAEAGLDFVGIGISGGEEGALNGPSIMPGGSERAWLRLKPMLEAIAAQYKGQPCVTHIGTDGAGHFVKMVHNGIEYADMQLIAEAYHLLRTGTGKTPYEIAEIFAQWNQGELNSYLIEITAEVLRQNDEATGKPLVDVILDQAGAKGTGAWTAQAALDLGVPATAITEAVYARYLSSALDQRILGEGLPEVVAPLQIQDEDQFVEGVRKSLYAAKIVAYSQGFDVMRAGAAFYDWQLDLAAIARIWRAGCIIRAQFLDRIAEAYDADPGLSLLMSAPYFADALAPAQAAWRETVGLAVAAGVPAPVFGSALSYYDGLRSGRLPAALIQGQRDFFGAHTYGRVDRPGAFHTDWSGDRRERQV